MAKSKSAFEYVGEPCLTRGEYGESVEVVHKLAWTPENGWYESEQGHAWGVWDSTYGWMPDFYLRREDIGPAVEVSDEVPKVR